MSFAATWIDLDIIILTDVIQKKTNIVWHHLYAKSQKKKVQMNLFMKEKHTQRTNYSYQVGEVGGVDWEIETDEYMALFEIDNQWEPSA